MAKPTMTKPAAKAAAKPKAVSRKATAKAVKKTDTPPKPRKDRRGTPKGKAVVAKAGRGRGGRVGNPKFEATPEQRLIVRTHAACGTPHWLIAEMLTPPISVDTLTRHFRTELDTGLLQVNARMSSLIAKQGLSGCRPSQRLWMGTRGGWSMKSSVELGGPDGGPIPIAAMPARNPNLKALSDKELEEYERLQAKLEGLDE